MLNRAKKKQCRNCLYHMGIIKSIVCPCTKCKVYGGKNPPVTLDTFAKDNKNLYQ